MTVFPAVRKKSPILGGRALHKSLCDHFIVFGSNRGRVDIFLVGRFVRVQQEQMISSENGGSEIVRLTSGISRAESGC